MRTQSAQLLRWNLPIRARRTARRAPKPPERHARVEAPVLFGATLGTAQAPRGAWRRAGLVALVVHAVAIGAAVALPATPRVVVEDEAPEVVFLQFSPAPASAGPALARVMPAEPIARPAPVVKKRPAPEVALPPKEPVVAPAPEVVERVAEPQVAEATAASSGDAAEIQAATGGTGSGGTAAGDGVVPGGTGFGMLGDAAVPAKQLAFPPRVLHGVEAAYPKSALRSGVQGRVVVRLIIGTDGHVEQDQVRILRSVPELDEAALVAARQWRFTPGRTAAGKVVRVVVDVPFQFSVR